MSSASVKTASISWSSWPSTRPATPSSASSGSRGEDSSLGGDVPDGAPTLMLPLLLAEMTEDDWDTVVAVHLKGHAAMSCAAMAYWTDCARDGAARLFQNPP